MLQFNNNSRMPMPGFPGCNMPFPGGPGPVPGPQRPFHCMGGHQGFTPPSMMSNQGPNPQMNPGFAMQNTPQIGFVQQPGSNPPQNMMTWGSGAIPAARFPGPIASSSGPGTSQGAMTAQWNRNSPGFQAGKMLPHESRVMGNIGVGSSGNVGVGPHGNVGVGPHGNVGVGSHGNVGVGPHGNVGVGSQGNVGVGSGTGANMVRSEMCRNPLYLKSSTNSRSDSDYGDGCSYSRTDSGSDRSRYRNYDTERRKSRDVNRYREKSRFSDSDRGRDKFSTSKNRDVDRDKGSDWDHEKGYSSSRRLDKERNVSRSYGNREYDRSLERERTDERHGRPESRNQDANRDHSRGRSVSESQRDKRSERSKIGDCRSNSRPAYKGSDDRQERYV